jgi:phosphopentomutase
VDRSIHNFIGAAGDVYSFGVLRTEWVFILTSRTVYRLNPQDDQHEAWQHLLSSRRRRKRVKVFFVEIHLSTTAMVIKLGDKHLKDYGTLQNYTEKEPFCGVVCHRKLLRDL